MSDNENYLPLNKRTPWNKGKLIGARPPLRPKHVWSIRTRLLLEGRIRDLALFNLAIDSKLRGCDVVAVRVEDVAPNGYTMDRATVRQKKTGRPVKFELTDQTRQAIDDYMKAAAKKPGEFLFAGRRCSSHCIHSTIRAAPFGMDRQYRARLKAVSHAFASANKGNANLPSNRKSTGGTALARSHKDRNTVRCLGIEVDDALAIAEQVDV